MRIKKIRSTLFEHRKKAITLCSALIVSIIDFLLHLLVKVWYLIKLYTEPLISRLRVSYFGSLLSKLTIIRWERTSHLFAITKWNWTKGLEIKATIQLTCLIINTSCTRAIPVQNLGQITVFFLDLYVCDYYFLCVKA